MITSSVKAIDRLTRADVDRMWAVFAAHYEGVHRETFDRDLAEKNAVVLLLDAQGVIQGFSTYLIMEDDAPDGIAHFLFSGDTIINHAHWGRNDFALTWIRNAGRLATLAPAGRLYWFLIVKGHRTYRYLPTFAYAFHPHWETKTPAPIKALADRLAQRRFGEDYDPETGLVRFAQPQGRLASKFAEIPPKDRARPEVEFFLRANPFYYRGDELVCLCRLSAENLKPIARRAFEAGVTHALERAM